MDPHMTQDDVTMLRRSSITHRRLNQSLSPPLHPSGKKKKLVNFRLSRRGSDDEQKPIKYLSLANRHSSIRNEPIQEETEEDRYKGDENNVKCEYQSMGPEGQVAIHRDVPIRSNLRAKADSSPPTKEPSLNQYTPTSNYKSNNNNNNGENGQCSKYESVPLQPRKIPPSNSAWEKVKTRASNESLSRRRNSLFSVVKVAVNKKRGTPPPSIWTPAVPRNQPAPRPGNWREQ
ncbi:hypothetical protein SK128_025930, partial [Halocaridina rubra]